MRWLVYDIETYKNFALFCFRDVVTKDQFLFEISDWLDQRLDLIDFFKRDIVLVGYNNHGFDDVVTNFTIGSKTATSWDIYKAAQMCITDGRARTDETKKFMWKWKNIDKYTIDLMTLHSSLSGRVSLKEMAISMNMPKIQDLPIHHTAEITKEQRDLIIDYCWNDVDVTEELYRRKTEDINLRLEAEREFGGSYTSKDRVNFGVDLLAKQYVLAGGSEEDLKKATDRPYIDLGEIILPYIKFNSKQLSDLLSGLKSKRISETKGSLTKTFIYKVLKITKGLVGLHSVDKPGIITRPQGWCYTDVDAGSFYPSMWIVNGWCPEHLNRDVFIPLLRKLRTDRITKWKPLAKKDKYAALQTEVIKLMMNGSFGKLIAKYGPFQDRKWGMAITINCQLTMLMLIEELLDKGFRVTSVNTDGITVMYPEERRAEFEAIIKAWETLTQMDMEYAEYEKVITKDINAYMAITTSGKVKDKGFFGQEVQLGKGFDKPVVKKALYDYFIKGIPVKQTIINHTNIYDFCMMKKTDSSFTTTWNNEVLQKTNRYYASKSKDAAYLYKNKSGKKTHQLKKSSVIIFNDYVAKPMSEYNIDYDYYITECQEIIDKIVPRQLTLF